MKKVLLIDSGSGGLNILHECVKVCPHFNFLYFADNMNLPYGEKSKKELIKITKKNLDKIKEIFDFEIVIFACNTITSTTIEEMRKLYKNIIFIGTEPAIKPALKELKLNEILVIATKATIENNKLINEQKSKGLKYKIIPNLPELIDGNLYDLDALQKTLNEELKEYRNVEGVVLGCTHFQAIEKQIKKALEKDVKFFSSAEGVAKRLKSYSDKKEIDFLVQFMVSGNQYDLQNFYNYYKNLDFI